MPQAFHLEKNCLKVGNFILNFVATISVLLFIRAKSEITTAKPNKPTNAAAKGTPVNKSKEPKVNLSIVSTLSIPIHPIKIPTQTPIKPFNIEPLVKAETMTNPIIPMRAISAFDDFKAMADITGINAVSYTHLTLPTI